MAARYNTVKEFKGYVTKPDATNMDERLLVKGSQNVLINDGEKVTGRGGYQLFGNASTTRKPINSEFVWKTSSGTELLLRGLDDKLQVYHKGSFIDVVEGFSTSEFGFPRSSESGWWDNSEGIDILPFVVKDSNLYTWSGLIAEIDSTTSNTITKTGTEAWAEARALTTGNKTVLINGTEYTYTGGETTTTLTGVTPDPTGEADGSIVTQKVVTIADTPGSGLTNDIVDILNNQVYVGDFTYREVFISENDDITDFTGISTPRVPGEPAVFTLDNAPTAFVVQEDSMYISAGKNDWYRTTFDLQTSGTTFIENVTVKKLKNAPYQGAKEKDLVANIKNSVVFISWERTLEELGRVERIETPQSKPLSDPIKPDFNEYDFAGGDIRYWKNQVFITIPLSGILLIYDIANGWWQPPQNIPVSKLSVYDNKLIGHSRDVSESYELFPEGIYSDLGNPVNMQAVFSYRSFGEREVFKAFDEYYTEGLISGSTKLTLTLDYEYEGSEGKKSFEIRGDDPKITFGLNVGGGLGSLPLGQATLGSASEAPSEKKKFRIVHGMRELPFYELRTTYSTTDTNAQFEIIAHGPQVRMSQNQNNAITK